MTDPSHSVSQSRWQFVKKALLRSAVSPGGEGRDATSVVSNKCDFELFEKSCTCSSELSVTEQITYYVSICDGCSVTLLQRAESTISIADLQNSSKCGVDSTGLACTWPAEEVLAYICLQRASIFRNARVLELGAGMTGMAGIIVATALDPSEVVITDGNPQTSEYLSKNIELNQSGSGDTKVSSKTLKWDENTDYSYLGKFDVVIMADCLFFEDFHSGLISLLSQVLRSESTNSDERISTENFGVSQDHSGGIVLSIAPRRSGSLGRFKKKAEMCFSVTEVENYDKTVWDKHCKFVENRDRYDPDRNYPVLLEMGNIL
eukprot:425968_1